MNPRLPTKEEYVTLSPLTRGEIDRLAFYYIDCFSKLKFIYVARDAWGKQLALVCPNVEDFGLNLTEAKFMSVAGPITLIKGAPCEPDIVFRELEGEPFLDEVPVKLEGDI